MPLLPRRSCITGSLTYRSSRRVWHWLFYRLHPVSVISRILFHFFYLLRHFLPRRCPFPTRFFDNGLVCAACRKTDKARKARERSEGKRCWFDSCNRTCTESFKAVPYGGLEEGGTWETLWSCHFHAFPGHLTAAPIPRETMKKMWWRWKKGL